MRILSTQDAVEHVNSAWSHFPGDFVQYQENKLFLSTWSISNMAAVYWKLQSYKTRRNTPKNVLFPSRILLL